MEHLNIGKNTTLWPPDYIGEIGIDMWTEESGNTIAYVSFDVLEKWVASIREQIIKSSNEQAKKCKMFGWCRFSTMSGCGEQCLKYTPVG